MIALVTVLGCKETVHEGPPLAPMPTPMPTPTAGSSAPGRLDVLAERPPADAAFRVAPETPTMADGTELPSACAELRKQMAKLATCEKLPAASREALQQAFTQFEQVWTATDRDQVLALEPTCRQAVDSMRQAAAGLCDL